MVHLISRGYVIPILTYISTISKNEKIDASLIRHFVIEVLDIIQEPYSDELKEIIYPLVQGKLSFFFILEKFLIFKKIEGLKIKKNFDKIFNLIYF